MFTVYTFITEEEGVMSYFYPTDWLGNIPSMMFLRFCKRCLAERQTLTFPLRRKTFFIKENCAQVCVCKLGVF